MECSDVISIKFNWSGCFYQMIYSKNFITALWWLSLIAVVSSMSGAQEAKFPADTAEGFSVSVAFEKATLAESDIKDVRSALEVWLKTSGKEIGWNLESNIYEDIETLLRDYKTGIIDVLNIGPDAYLRAEKEIKAEPAYIVLMAGKKTRKYILIVRSNAPINDVEDLKGKNLAVMKTNRIGYFYLNLLLLRKRLGKPEDYFSTIAQKTKFSQAILSVFFGQADACIATESALQTMFELNPQLGRQLKIIASSPEIPHLIAFFRPDLSRRIKEFVLKEVTRLQDTPKGRQILTLFRIDGVLPAHESDLDTLRELLKEYNQLLGKR